MVAMGDLFSGFTALGTTGANPVRCAELEMAVIAGGTTTVRVLAGGMQSMLAPASGSARRSGYRWEDLRQGQAYTFTKLDTEQCTPLVH